jgi:hypothetical protein
MLSLIGAAVGVVVGLPIALFGFMRLDERPGKASWAILICGLLITLGPTAAAAILHYQTSDTGRYQGR